MMFGVSIPSSARGEFEDSSRRAGTCLRDDASPVKSTGTRFSVSTTSERSHRLLRKRLDLQPGLSSPARNLYSERGVEAGHDSEVTRAMLLDPSAEKRNEYEGQTASRSTTGDTYRRQGAEKGGIIIPDSAKEKPMEGKVIAVGSGRVLDDGKKIPLEVKVGDRVLLGRYAGTEVKIDDQKLLILKESDILALIDE